MPIEFSDISTLTIAADPANALNIVATLGLIDTDTGQPPIEPTTGQPIANVQFKGNDLDETVLKKLMGEFLFNLNRRISFQATRDANLASLTALKAAGGKVDPTPFVGFDPLQLALEAAMATLAKLQVQVDTGVLKDTDAEYTDAVAAAKAAKAALEAKPK